MCAEDRSSGRRDAGRGAHGEHQARRRPARQPVASARPDRACDIPSTRCCDPRYAAPRTCRIGESRAREAERWRGRDSRSRLRACTAAALLLLMSAHAAAGLQPLLGASLTWSVSKRFMSGERYVNFTLKTAFEMAGTCNYTVGRPVACQPASGSRDGTGTQACDYASTPVPCHVAARHGVLCVGQVVQSKGGSGLELMYSGIDGGESCVSDVTPGFLRSTVLSFEAFNATFASADYGRTCHAKWCNSTCANNCTQTRGGAVGNSSVVNSSLADSSFANRSFSRCMHQCFMDAASRAPASHVGKVNVFTVTSTYTNQGDAHQGTNGVDLAIGMLQHQVHVAPEAVALVAWLQPGVLSFGMFNNSFNTSGCQGGWCGSSCAQQCVVSAHANQNVSGSETYRRCMYECFILLAPRVPSEAAGASIWLPPCTGHTAAHRACSTGADAQHRSTWKYWDEFDQVLGTPSKPLTQTFVPLCAASLQPPNVTTAPAPHHRRVVRSCASLGLAPCGNCSETKTSCQPLNLHSPQPSFPFLVQVPSPPRRHTLGGSSPTYTTSSDGDSASGPQSSSTAPHPPMYFRATDADGHRMTQEIVLMHTSSSTSLANGTSAGPHRAYNVRCFLADLDNSGPGTLPWPSRQCVAGRREGFSCTANIECPSMGLTASTLFENCTETWSKCQEYGNAGSTHISGNAIKFDFDFASVDLANMTGSSGASFFTQHIVATYDLPSFGALPLPSPQVAGGADGFETFNTSFNETACQGNWCNSSCAGKCATSANANQNVSGSYAYRRCMYECFLLLSPLAARLNTPSETLEQAGAPAQWHDSQAAASPLLFSAFLCDSGTENQAPVFVAGLLSTETRLRSEFSCTSEEACEIPLFARDFRPDEAVDSSDDISIKAAVGFEELDHRSLFKPDGSICRGVGSLFCIFKLDAQALRGSAAGTVTRCFVAFDTHDVASAPRQRTCSSMPYCINVRYDVFPSWRGLDPRIPVPVVQLKTSDAQHVRGAFVFVKWAGEPLAVINAGISDAVKSDVVTLQYTSALADGLQQHFYDIPTRYITRVDTYEAFLSVEDLLRMAPCISTQCSFAFRLAFRHSSVADSAEVCSGDLFYGPASNPVMAVPATLKRPDKSLIVAEWQNHILRVWDMTAARRGEPALATVPHCHSVTPGTLTIDSTGNRLFAIIERVRDDASSLRPHLLVVDLVNGAQRQIALGVDVSFRNVEYDEAADVVLAMQFSAQEADSSQTAFLVSFDPTTGNKTVITSLQELARTAISAFSRRERIYYYVSQRNGNIQRISLPSAKRREEGSEVGVGEAELRQARHLSPMTLHASPCSQCGSFCAGCDNNVVHAMFFSDHDRLLYALEASWPFVDDGSVTLTSYDPTQGALSRRIFTTITGRDMAYAVAAFHVNMSDIVIVTSQGRYTSYNLAANASTHEEARDFRIVGKVVHVERLQDRSPLITAMMPPSVLTKASTKITVSGFNFGMRDLSPSIEFLPLLGVPCKETSWLSDNAVACHLPNPSAFEWFPDFDASALQGLPVEVEVRVGSRRSNAAFVNTQLPSFWMASDAELSSSVLTFPRHLTIFGDKFHEPFLAYRSVFSSDVYLATSAPPTSYNRTHLTFEVPAWLSAAEIANVSLRRMSSALHSSWPDTIVHTMGSATRIHFTEAWELVSRQTMEALQVTLVTITGSGFDTGANASYECLLHTNLNEYVRHDMPSSETPAHSNSVTIRAEIHSHRQAACHIRWPFAAGRVCLWLVHEGRPVSRTAGGNFASPACAEFVFTQGWSSLSPTQSSIGDTILTYITGFGFNASAEYFCSFSPLDSSTNEVATPVLATVVNVTTLSCAVGPSVGEAAFPTALVTLSYASEQGVIAAVTKHGAPQLYEFLPAFSRLRPTSSDARGGIPLSIFGFGLPSGLQYQCTFADPQKQQAFSAVAAFWKSSNILECLVPVWQYPAGQIKVDVSRRDPAAGSIESVETETFDFEFLEVVLMAQHTAWSYAAVSDIRVTFTGLGFDPNKLYSCVLAANQRDPASPENAMAAGTVSLRTSVEVAAVSSTRIVCPPMEWPYFSGQVEVLLLRGTAVPGPGSPSSLMISERWTDAEPRALFASGASITVAGHGFSGVAADYMCEFAQTGRGENRLFSVRASNASLSRIICNLPPGIATV